MPWQQTWVPAPKDESIEVLSGTRDLPPQGFELDELYWGTRTAQKRIPYKTAYHCCFCNGWIEGQPNEFPVNTLGPLRGRSGIESYCRRCGNEIGFVGKMA